MQSLGQISALCTLADKRFHGLDFFQGARLEATRVVENEPGIAFEDEFVFDVMDSPLCNKRVRVNWEWY